MKRVVSLILVFVLCCSIMVPFASALNLTDDAKDEEIERLFYEIGELALQEEAYVGLQQQGMICSDEPVDFSAERSALDAQLEQLGVHKLDPDNSADLSRLEEIVDSVYGNTTNSTRSIDDKPNVAVLASRYAVYESSGDYTLNGVKYPYCYYRVIDNGEGGFTRSMASVELLGRGSMLLQELLEYNFKFGLSQFLGSIPTGTLIEWTLGNIFTILNSFNTTTTVGPHDGNIYSFALLSVTQMEYYFMYSESLGEWVQAGSSAPQIKFARTDVLVANIGGSAVSKSPDMNFYSSTNLKWTEYYRNLINTGRQTHSSIGYLTVEGNGHKYSFTPKYYSALHSIPT